MTPFESVDTVHEAGEYRKVVVEPHPLFARVRLKGMRSYYDVEWGAIWALGAKAEANRMRSEKKAKK